MGCASDFQTTVPIVKRDLTVHLTANSKSKICDTMVFSVEKVYIKY